MAGRKICLPDDSMKLDKKVIGLCFAYNGKDEELGMVYEAGFRWLRMGIPFPWEDKMFGTLTQRYIDAKAAMVKAHEKGFSVMPTTPGLGSWRFDHNINKTVWMDSWPSFCGEKGTDEYYDNVCATTAWIAKDLEGIAGPLWCNMNEIDIPTFHGDYPVEVAAETAFQSAKGIVSADPDALCGINLSRYYEEGIRVADMAYREGHYFGYIGDDQYFGSWQGHCVETWNEVIDKLHEHFNLPVLANEWGYSSGGEVKEKPEDESVIAPGLNSVCHVFGWHHAVEGGHTEEVQARYIRRGLEIFRDNPHVLGSFLFCWKDAKYCYHCGKELCPSECFWGIVHQDTSPKPAYFAVKEFTENNQ